MQTFHWQGFYSPSTHYPSYVGWQLVLGRSNQQALNRKDTAVHTPVHHA